MEGKTPRKDLRKLGLLKALSTIINRLTDTRLPRPAMLTPNVSKAFVAKINAEMIPKQEAITLRAYRTSGSFSRDLRLTRTMRGYPTKATTTETAMVRNSALKPTAVESTPDSK